MTIEPVIRALRFNGADHNALLRLSDAQWRRLLALTDRTQLTLALGARCGKVLPDFVRARIHRDLASNAARHASIAAAYDEIRCALADRGIDFVVLKGVTHDRLYAAHPAHRPQYDIDLLCPPEQALRARDAVDDLGYEALGGFAGIPVDHLPTMIRKTGWRWRGDYYDPGMPPSVEVHFRLWDRANECFDVDGLERFWQRRTVVSTPTGEIPALHPADRIAYAALHVIRHLLRGDLRLYHTYEIAHFLERSANDEGFWDEWRGLHPSSLRRVEAVAFRLALEWFAPKAARVAQQEMEAFPERVEQWFETFGKSPYVAITRPNKDELWLHLALVETRSGRHRVLMRRLIPLRPSPVHFAAHVPVSAQNWRLQLARCVFTFNFVVKRGVHHLLTVRPLLAGGVRWWWRGKQVNRSLLHFLAASFLFNFGQSIYFLLYNLHLLRTGFHEDLLGFIASAMAAGSIAGTVPAGIFARRFGLRATVLTAFLTVPVLGILRATVTGPPMLIAAAFASGFVFSAYAVSLAPVVAALTTKQSRAFGFGLVVSLGIGAGALAGLIGGHLPVMFGLAKTGGFRSVLLVASCLAMLSFVVGARWLRIPGVSREELATASPRGHRSAPFLVRFLAAVSLWWLATGVLNTFFNAYFTTELKMGVDRIGFLFSISQTLQVAGVLIAPLILRRFGLINGIACMQLTTAAALAAMATGAGQALTGALYCSYMAFQYMSEPGLFTVLMNGVRDTARSSASSVNFFVMFGVQAIVATIAGLALRHFGYRPVLLIAALGAALAAVTFRTLLAERTPREQPECPGDTVPRETAAPIAGAPPPTAPVSVPDHSAV